MPATARRLLGVAPGATEVEIRSAFRREAWAQHPDRGGHGDLAQLRTARDALLRDLRRPQPGDHRPRAFVRRTHPLRRAARTALRRRTRSTSTRKVR